MNAQSLLNKKKILASDFNIQSATSVAFADTRHSSSNNNCSFGNFNPDLTIQLPNDQRPSLGLVVYSMEKALDIDTYHFEYEHSQVGSCIAYRFHNLLKINGVFQKIVVFYFYLLPGLSNKIYEYIACQILPKIQPTDNLILMGDFNRLPSEMGPFLKPLSEMNLVQTIEGITQDFGRTIDHCYTNLPPSIFTSGCLDTLSNSDHRPIFITLRRE